MTTKQEWMTVKGVAEYLRAGTDLVCRLAQEGKVPASTVGAQWRFKREKVDLWMQSQEAKPRGN